MTTERVDKNKARSAASRLRRWGVGGCDDAADPSFGLVGENSIDRRWIEVDTVRDCQPIPGPSSLVQHTAESHRSDDSVAMGMGVGPVCQGTSGVSAGEFFYPLYFYDDQSLEYPRNRSLARYVNPHGTRNGEPRRRRQRNIVASRG